MFLAAETRPEDEVLALWSLDAVVVADRRSVPEVSLGLFSYWDLPTARARDLHFLNPELLLELVRTARPAAVVLTDLDRGTLRRAGVVSKRPGAPEPIFAALERRYTRAFTGSGFGMSEPVTVEVYLRR